MVIWDKMCLCRFLVLRTLYIYIPAETEHQRSSLASTLRNVYLWPVLFAHRPALLLVLCSKHIRLGCTREGILCWLY